MFVQSRKGFQQFPDHLKNLKGKKRLRKGSNAYISHKLCNIGMPSGESGLRRKKVRRQRNRKESPSIVIAVNVGKLCDLRDAHAHIYIYIHVCMYACMHTWSLLCICMHIVERDLLHFFLSSTRMLADATYLSISMHWRVYAVRCQCSFCHCHMSCN